MTTTSPQPRPGATTRPPDLVRAVRAASLTRHPADTPVARAWEWALTGTCPSPITGQPPAGTPPHADALITEAKTVDGTTYPPSDRIYDTDPEIGAARRVLEWLAANTDEIPLPAGERGALIGARDDYARTRDQIHEVLTWARMGLPAASPPQAISPEAAMRPWQWPAGWMDAAWLQGTADMLSWVNGEHDTAPLSGARKHLPALADAADEYGLAYDVLNQGRPGGQPVQPDRYPPPQYGEAIQATYQWLAGESTTPPTDPEGHGPYNGSG